jgi:hypothetical protein
LGTGFGGNNCEIALQGTCGPTQVANSDKLLDESIRGTLGNIISVACNQGYINTNGNQMTCVGSLDVYEPWDSSVSGEILMHHLFQKTLSGLDPPQHP